MKDSKKQYKTPSLVFSSCEIDDIICVSLVDGEHDIFDFDEEL